MTAPIARSRLARGLWATFGLAAVAIGGIGIVVPGLPTTVFFIIAAWAFSKSSPRLEAWVLGLPRIGPYVEAHRRGEGMPRRAKVVATTMIATFSIISVVLLDATAVRVGVVALALTGIAYILLAVPTTERVLAEAVGAER